MILILISYQLQLVVWIVVPCYVDVHMVVVHCSVLYHKSLSSCIIPLASSSNRFCGRKVIDSNGSSILMISLYMPSECRHSLYYFTEYLNTLGELEGLIETEKCDVNMLIGDFNVDFCRDRCLSRLLLDFMSELDLCACDLSFCN